MVTAGALGAVPPEHLVRAAFALEAVGLLLAVLAERRLRTTPWDAENAGGKLGERCMCAHWLGDGSKIARFRNMCGLLGEIDCPGR